ncbi:MAG TPA: hypothetical protein PLL77_15135 [Pyrinomonadaceae bacterium]|nr:hypothetical protein [Pyrinomonadaceae bacterium]
MIKYFLLTWKNTAGAGVSAFPRNYVGLAQDLARSLVNSSELPFDLILVKLTPHRNGLDESSDLSGLRDAWPDYMPNRFAWPLCSAKLREVISRHLIHDEGLNWIPAKISGAGETREYYIARFDTMHDVLDNEKTTYVPETTHIIRPWFSIAKVNGLSIFPKPSDFDLWRITSSIFIRDSLKREIVNAGITGVAFEQAHIS